MIKLTRVRAKDKSIGGTTHGHKWRYNADIGEMEVPENVAKTLITSGDFMEVKPPKKAPPRISDNPPLKIEDG